MKGRAPPRNVNDPEAQMTSRAAFPSMSGTARDVTNSLFRVSPEESNVYSAPHRSDRQTGVTREREADTAQADPDLPSYRTFQPARDPHSMLSICRGVSRHACTPASVISIARNGAASACPTGNRAADRSAAKVRDSASCSRFVRLDGHRLSASLPVI